MILVQVISNEVKKGLRDIKAFVMSKARTAYQSAPAGIDSAPIAGMRAIYGKTTNNSEPVIIGYMNESEVGSGEIKIKAFDANGVISYIYCKDDGNVELNGKDDNAIRYTPLDSELSDFKGQIQEELTKIATGITGVGGAYTPGILTLDISDSKIDNLLTS